MIKQKGEISYTSKFKAEKKISFLKINKQESDILFERLFILMGNETKKQKN